MGCDIREGTLDSQRTVNRRCMSELLLLLHITLLDCSHFEGFCLCSLNSILDQVTSARYHVDMAVVARCPVHF